PRTPRGPREAGCRLPRAPGSRPPCEPAAPGRRPVPLPRCREREIARARPRGLATGSIAREAEGVPGPRPSPGSRRSPGGGAHASCVRDDGSERFRGVARLVREPARDLRGERLRVEPRGFEERVARAVVDETIRD